MPGRVVFAAWNGRPPREWMPRAREVLAVADAVVSPAEIDVRALVPERCEILQDDGVDEVLARARRGQNVVFVSADSGMGADAVAVACSGVDVELVALEKSPLFGKRVLVTRTREQASGTALLLRIRGAEPVLVPAIEIHAPRDPQRLARAIEQLAGVLCVVFTSANGVERAWAEVLRQGKDARAFGGVVLAAIGPGTARALEAYGLRADVVGREFTQEGLATELVAALAGKKKGRILLLRAEVARDALPDALRAARHEVDVVAAYETRAPEPSRGAWLTKELEEGRIDAVTFTSSSTVDNLADMLGPRAPELLAKTVVASIGPVTSKTCGARGIGVSVTAESYTLVGLVESLDEFLARKEKGR